MLPAMVETNVAVLYGSLLENATMELLLMNMMISQALLTTTHHPVYQLAQAVTAAAAVFARCF